MSERQAKNRRRMARMPRKITFANGSEIAVNPNAPDVPMSSDYTLLTMKRDPWTWPTDRKPNALDRLMRELQMPKYERKMLRKMRRERLAR